MLTDEEMMQFIILPLSYKEKEEKKLNLDYIIDMAKQIEDKQQQLFVLSGILTFTDKIINQEMAEKIREAIEMTQVARIFEEEKRQAVMQIMKQYEAEKIQTEKRYEEEKLQTEKRYEEEKLQTEKQYEAEKFQTEKRYEEEKRQESEQLIMKMLKKNYPPEEIATLVTGYTVEQIEKIRANISAGGIQN